ncbi:hypothetical protein JHK85_010331 [Glycine max]|uniref:Glutathione S-transferase T1 n=1 Tax=Glycine soja TaxID=3848 RepID=A0A0B2P7J5_GLYSO|nr:hypothetical protein JHK85_010331 [Glycine max]KAG5066324.1 hypothetical protein JHK86_010055 [Glycine max]KHN03597.1 Glutathione S-transferase T1 [Glycine soja]
MKLKVYADRMSQPSLNGIDFEEIKVDLSKRQQLSPEFREDNPLRKVSAIVDERFKLFERGNSVVTVEALEIQVFKCKLTINLFLCDLTNINME